MSEPSVPIYLHFQC